ncbi:alpha/beta hydrolase [Spongiibacter sp. KMU-158]|uniref:Alpha/beta hydrolase n=1 Tax=Spongiibacter pelagi TaxID=2760804 RepID=A0A927GUL9_9GAMM|nr:alpha/beta hydrolase [Spongiibacter pelagi]MBD2857731.1 alpha/beta hydrolase [Spongiibacter pelagi]
MKQPNNEYQLTSIKVPGGELAVAKWGRAGPVILAIHGITASHREFLALADALGTEYQLIAPDLRGRGNSRNISGPWGMLRHAQDMIAALDHFGVAQADIVLGHSMGGFVAAVMGAEFPERCRSILMVDGGLPIMPSLPIHRIPLIGEWLIEKIVRKVLGPALDRLDMHFASKEIYRDFWRDQAALKDHWSHYVEAYLDYDLYPTDQGFRPSTNKAALLEDVKTQLFENVIPQSLKKLKGPVRFLRAERGLQNDKPLYPLKSLIKAGKQIQGFSMTDIEDSNHYTILLSDAGANQSVAEIKQLLASL